MGQMAEGTGDIGSADLRTGDTSLSDLGRSSTTAAGGTNAEERAGAPGTLELGAKPGLFRRETGRVGRVRSYVRD